MNNVQSGPTFISELKRSFNFYNLSIAFISSVSFGAIMYIMAKANLFPDFDTHQALPFAIIFSIYMFLLSTLLHAAIHCYFGWRFEKGIEAYRQGNYVKALRLLAPVELPGMDHYDTANHAASSLQICRFALEESRSI